MSPLPTMFETPCGTPTVTVATNIEFVTIWTAEAPPEMFSFASVSLGDFGIVKRRVHLGDTARNEIDIALRQVMHTINAAVHNDFFQCIAQSDNVTEQPAWMIGS